MESGATRVVVCPHASLTPRHPSLTLGLLDEGLDATGRPTDATATVDSIESIHKKYKTDQTHTHTYK